MFTYFTIQEQYNANPPSPPPLWGRSREKEEGEVGIDCGSHQDLLDIKAWQDVTQKKTI